MADQNGCADPGQIGLGTIHRDLADLDVRPATGQDVPAICLLERTCFTDPWSEDSLYHDLVENPAAHYLVAVMPNNCLIGYVAWWLVVDEAEIINLAVSPEWRGRRLGYFLLTAMIDKAACAGVARIHLEVRESNQAARHLYDQAGFRQIGIRAGYYTDSYENAITMLKSLT